MILMYVSKFLLTIILTLTSHIILHPSPPLPPLLPGQSVRFNHITPEQGLANSRVLSITQDRQGFMWFGTGEGLNRYDGYDFILYQSAVNDPQTLSSNVIWALYEDREGYLWVGTDGGGLNRFDPNTETFTRYQPDPDDAHSISDSTVVSIYEDQEGVLWVGTLRGGLNRFDRESETFIQYQHDPADPHSLSHNEVHSIVEDEDGTLWIGTYGGLNQLVPGKGASDSPTFRRFQHDPTDPQSLSSDQVHALYADHLGFLWIGTWGGGLNRFDPATETFVRYRPDADDPDTVSSDIIVAIDGDPQGDLWIGSWDGGLEHFARASETFVHYQHNPADPLSLSRNLIRSLYISRDGLLFVGTAGGGLNVLDPARIPFRTLRHQPGDPNSISQSDVRSILHDQEGQLWIGTQSGGLNHYDPSTGLFTHYRHDPDDPTSLSNDTVLALSEDPDGSLWVGTQRGLNRLDRNTGRFVRYQHDPADPHSLGYNTIWTLYTDRAGTLWVGTYGGLNRFDRETETFTHYLSNPADPTTLSHDTIVSFYEDASGTLWVGTQGGLNRFDRQKGTFTRYLHNPDDPASIINDSINDSINVIHGDSNGMLWLGTFEGLDRFDPRSGRAVHYQMHHGLSSNVVWGILPDEQGNLWISTNQGLNRFDPRTKAFRTYDIDDGLVTGVFNGFAFHKSHSGEIWFGGPDGLLVFDPAQITEEPYAPSLVFTDFQLDNRPVPIGEDSILQLSINQTRNLTLSHQDRVVSFQFAALNYQTPSKMRYRYVLRGFDTHWTEVDSERRFVTYTNLDPGDYQFAVQSAVGSEEWSTPGRVINLTIVPPWWQTAWFRFALAGLLLASLGGAYRFRVAMLEQRNQMLERQVDDKTAALQLLNAELEDSIAELTTLNEVAVTLNQVTPGEPMLEKMAVTVTGLFQATGGAIGLLNDDHSELYLTNYHQAVAPASPDAAAAQNGFQPGTIRVAMPQTSELSSLFDSGKPRILHEAEGKSMLPVTWSWLQQYNFAHFMLAPILVRSDVVGVIAVAREKSDYGFTDDDMLLVETIAHQVAGAVENSRLFNEEQWQRELAEQRSRELTTLLNISHEVSSILELDPLLDMILHHLAQAIDFSSLIIMELIGDELAILAQRGIASADLPADDGFSVAWMQESTEIFATRRPLIVSDLRDDPPMQELLHKTFGPRAARLLVETQSCIIAPMVARDRVMGLLWFGHGQPGYYTDSQADYVIAIAHQAAIALENAHHLQDMQAAAAYRERNRLAQELHDSVSQTLYAANMVAKRLPNLFAEVPDEASEAIRQLHQMIQISLAEMRTLMVELQPAILAQKPIGEIIRHLCDSFTSRSQLPVKVTINGDTILPAVCQIAFYRIVQGALNNIQHHAQATQVTVELNCTPAYAELLIADDGVGFDLAAVPPDRMGLTIMRQRAEQFGAIFQVTSAPGRGTQICVRYDYPIG